MGHRHKVQLCSKKPFSASADSSWFSCREHNPNLDMSVEFLASMLQRHPEWFEISGSPGIMDIGRIRPMLGEELERAEKHLER